MLQKLLYFKVVMLLPLKLLMPPYRLAGIFTLTYGVQSTVLGGLGACPRENFEKLHLLRLNLWAFLVIYQPLMFL